MRKSKIMTAQEVVSKFISDGMTVGIGGFFHSPSYSITHEIIRQKKAHLTICQPSFNEHADQMIGAGCVDRIVSSYVWMEVFGPLYCFRRAMEKEIPHKIEMEDYTNFAVMARYLAGSLGVPYIPIHSMKGSDMMKYRAWEGEKKSHPDERPLRLRARSRACAGAEAGRGLFPLPARRRGGEQPDVGHLGRHAMEHEGLQGGHRVVRGDHYARANRTGPQRTIVPGYKVVGVVPAPFGAHPKHCQGYYDVDRDFIFKYIRKSATEEGWKKYMDEWVYGVADRDEYLKKYVDAFGMKKFLGLKAKDMMSTSVNYGF